MEVQFNWVISPSFEVRHPDEIQRIARIINGIDLPITSVLTENESEDEITLFLMVSDEEVGRLVYADNELSQIEHNTLVRDIFRCGLLMTDNDIEIIQHVFDHYRAMSEWPSSRRVGVELRHLGDYSKVAGEIGSHIIRIGDLNNNTNAKSILSVLGMFLCEEFEDYLVAFLRTLNLMVNRYVELTETPVISSEELVDEGIVDDGNEEIIYDLILAEGSLSDGSSRSQDGPFTLSVSPAILEFEHVNSIGQYINIAYKSRISNAIIKRARSRGLAFAGTDEGGYDLDVNEGTVAIYDLFISYSFEDSEHASKIAAGAQSLGIGCFLAEKDIKSGDEWADKIRDALNNSREVAILVTPNSLNSSWVQREESAAWALYKHLTPILFDCTESDLSDILKTRHYIRYDNLEKFYSEVIERRR